MIYPVVFDTSVGPGPFSFTFRCLAMTVVGCNDGKVSRRTRKMLFRTRAPKFMGLYSAEQSERSLSPALNVSLM